MAEKEEAPMHLHKRNTHSNRAHPGQNRLYSQLGVKDLRELLDRKRSERGQNQEVSIAPPDPSYNYLKDPLRENEDNSLQEQSGRPNYTRRYHNKNHANNNFKRDGDSYGGNAPNHSRNKDIENPLNIKVEFSTSTGEHVYKMDETTILPTIKHIPDKLPTQNKSFRGRGRGRGRGQQRTYQTRTIRNNNAERRTPKNSLSEDNKQGSGINPPPILGSEENWDDLNENKSDNNAEHENLEQEEADENDVGKEEHLENNEIEESLEAGVQNLNLDERRLQDDIVGNNKHEEDVEQNK